jgi:exosortase O
MLRTTWIDRLRSGETNWRQLVANAGLVLIWLALYRRLFDYLALLVTSDDFRTNQLLLLGVVTLIVFQARRGDRHLQLDAAPQFQRTPLLLTLGASVGFLLCERFLNVNTLSAALFGLATYGLLGLWMQPAAWQLGLPVALLLIGVLPFGDHLQTFVGYPMRIATAHLVRDGLTAVGVHSIGVDTILVFENGVSQVDVPCSGVKSLWTGALFFLAATWVQRRPLNGRWLLVAALFAGLLFMANLARVTALTAVGEVAGWRLAAQMLHVPLGVLGFAAVCATVALLLAWFVKGGEASDPTESRHLQSVWLTPTLMVAIGLMALFYAPRTVKSTTPQPAPTWSFPTGLSMTPLPLTTREEDWLASDGAESAERWRFQWRGLSGSLILIASSTWRGHHRPERCFEVYGLTLDDSRTHLVNADFPLRFVTLGDGKANGVLSASYWFQSAQRTTNDYGARIWSDLAPERQRWVLVSILFDDVIDPNAGDTAAFYRALRSSVAQGLE